MIIMMVLVVVMVWFCDDSDDYDNSDDEGRNCHQGINSFTLTWIYDWGTWFFPNILKVPILEWQGKGGQWKKSSVNQAGLKSKIFGIDTPCLLHEMCWCHQRGFFIGLHRTWLGKNGVFIWI